MADLAKALKRAVTDLAQKQAVREVEAQFKAIGLNPVAPGSDSSRAKDSALVSELREWIKDRSAALSSEVLASGLSELTSKKDPSKSRVAAPKKPSTSPAAKAPKVQGAQITGKSSDAPVQAPIQSEATQKVVAPLEPPAPAPEMGSSITFDGVVCTLSDFANATGYAIRGQATEESAGTHFAHNLEKICGAILEETPEAVQGLRNRVIGQRRTIEHGGVVTPVFGVPHADLINTLSTIAFTMGGVAYAENSIGEPALNALKSCLLRTGSCAALVYPNGEGQYEVILAAPTDVKKLRAEIEKQL